MKNDEKNENKMKKNEKKNDLTRIVQAQCTWLALNLLGLESITVLVVFVFVCLFVCLFVSVCHWRQPPFHPQHLSGTSIRRGGNHCHHMLWLAMACTDAYTTGSDLLLHSELLPQDIKVRQQSTLVLDMAGTDWSQDETGSLLLLCLNSCHPATSHRSPSFHNSEHNCSSTWASFTVMCSS